MHVMATLLQSTPGYDTVRTWVMAAGNNIAFKIAAKLLQTNMVTVDSL